jgi:OmpA-OmpF porin, OOP family
MKTILVCMLILLPILAQSQDLAHSQDHPLISRYPGQVITRFDVKEFDHYKLVLGVKKSGEPDQIQQVEGKVTRINYRNPQGRSTTEIIRNFENALRASGAQVLFSCEARACGTPIRWTSVNGIRNMGGLIDNRYVAAQLKRSKSEAFISVFVGSGATQIDVIEPKPMEDGLVTVNASALAAGIDAEGHVAVYDILFDSGKSTIKPESKLAIDEIAKLLRQRPELKLFVVGHTDSTGGFERNMILSRERAAAITQFLVSECGITPARLTPHGAGPLSPVASNNSEAGRARNRRVELVAN